jgi:hypothetical protein
MRHGFFHALKRFIIFRLFRSLPDVEQIEILILLGRRIKLSADDTGHEVGNGK